MVDRPQPELDADEVLVRIKAVGICGSDVHGMTGTTGRRIPPIVMGHEASGEVVRVGDRADDTWLSRRVTFDSTIYCGTCRYCTSGRVNLCDRRRVLGVSCDEYRRDGAMAEYVAVPARVLYEIPQEVSWEHASMVEPAAIALHAARIARLSPGSSATVIGAGVIGLLTIQALRAIGAGVIRAVDPIPFRRATALRCGADEVHEPGREIAESDVVFDAVGSATTVSTAVERCAKGGTIVLVGNLVASVTLPLQRVVTRELRVLGSCASAGEYTIALDYMARGAIDVAPILSVTAPLSEAASYFDTLHRDPEELLKVVLQPEG
ncbi:MAG: alcohol dehydrogenase catalytic domain-containing protein [Spirochaetales bacterium]|nr:alcohol dehydrogenase catalytic domain-containing protein [Spirochaetales bacterium]